MMQNRTWLVREGGRSNWGEESRRRKEAGGNTMCHVQRKNYSQVMSMGNVTTLKAH
jgi:hypothetical protein